MTLTTGQVAKFCDVSNRQVCRWMEKGLLKGYRLPGSEHRRFPITEVKEFMIKNLMPTQRLDQYVEQNRGT